MCVLDKYPGAEERLRKQGHHNLVEMARRFDRPHEIDKALGYNSAASHWFAGRNAASKAADRAARLWLDANTPQQQTSAVPDTIVEPAREHEQPDATILMVVCPPNKAEKALKMLHLIGCEVEEI